MSLSTVINEIVQNCQLDELKDVIYHIETAFEKDCKREIDDAIENYNLNEFAVVQLPGCSTKTVVSKYSQIGSKFVDYENQKLFSMKLLKPIDIEDHEYQYDSSLSELQINIKNYLNEHYPSEHAHQLIPPQESGNEIVLIIFGWKFNSSNYYSGQWKSIYRINESTSTVTGEIKLDIHYHENANVKFKNVYPISSFEFTSTNDIINKINELENGLEMKINSSFKELNDKSFKNLRRLLPVTRSKINWGKAIGNYRLGQDVAGGRDTK